MEGGWSSSLSKDSPEVLVSIIDPCQSYQFCQKYLKNMFTYIQQFRQEPSLLNIERFGFLRDTFMSDRLSLVEEVYETISQGNFPGMVQLDFSKAFDLNNHKLPVQKLYNCVGHTLKSSPYLADHTQKVATIVSGLLRAPEYKPHQLIFKRKQTLYICRAYLSVSGRCPCWYTERFFKLFVK